jgi:hypothetical protein
LECVDSTTLPDLEVVDSTCFRISHTDKFETFFAEGAENQKGRNSILRIIAANSSTFAESRRRPL